MKKYRNVVLLTLLLLNVGCDQISKEVAREHLNYHEHHEVLGDFLSLIKIENTGAFLSLGQNWPDFLRIGLLTVIPLLFILGGIYFMFTSKKLDATQALAICFMLGGGIGNMIDRLLYGSVTDFLHMDFFLFQTGIFNLADVSIMCGIGIYLLHQFTTGSKKQEEPA